MASEGIVMNSRRLRPKWTLGTMLLVVGWSSVVVWLNVRRTIFTHFGYLSARYGYPWTCAVACDPNDPSLEPPRFRPEYIYSHWHLAANVAIGLIAVFILTWTSRAILSALRAFMSKPPPDNLNGD